MKTLKQFLEGKTRPLVSVAPADTVLRCLEVMAQQDVGALLVLDGERLAGVFSERDYARRVVLKGKASGTTPVSDVMTRMVHHVTPENSIDECMAIMTEKHVRHLPVLDRERKVIGIVSIGDVVKETIEQQKFIINQLESYIAN